MARLGVAAHHEGVSTVISPLIDLMLDPAVVAGAVATSVTLLSGLAARLAEWWTDVGMTGGRGEG